MEIIGNENPSAGDPPQTVAVVPAATQDRGFMAIIDKVAALDNIDVDKLERMMQMQMQWEDRSAKKAFDEAKARVSVKLAGVKITKTRAVAYDIDRNDKAKGKETAFKYAAIEDIDKIVRPILNDEGLTVSYDVEPSTIPGWHTIVCWLAYSGYREAYRMPMPLDTHSKRSGAQNMGSTLTYGQRRALCMALNIVVVGEDDDGMDGCIDDAQAAHIKKLIETSNTDTVRFLQKICHGAKSVEEIIFKDYRAAVSALNEKIAKNQKAAPNANPPQS